MDTIFISLIQAMLTPGVMISACGLLLLGINNKYSLVINRLRLLDEEERKLSEKKKENHISDYDNFRLRNITVQIPMLMKRVKLIRNAVFSYSLAVGFFVATSLLIGIKFFTDFSAIHYLIITCFFAGVLCILLGVLYAARETIKGYAIIKIEIVQL